MFTLDPPFSLSLSLFLLTSHSFLLSVSSKSTFDSLLHQLLSLLSQPYLASSILIFLFILFLSIFISLYLPRHSFFPHSLSHPLLCLSHCLMQHQYQAFSLCICCPSFSLSVFSFVCLSLSVIIPPLVFILLFCLFHPLPILQSLSSSLFYLSSPKFALSFPL